MGDGDALLPHGDHFMIWRTAAVNRFHLPACHLVDRGVESARVAATLHLGPGTIQLTFIRLLLPCRLELVLLVPTRLLDHVNDLAVHLLLAKNALGQQVL